MSPIKGISEVRRLPRLGKIHLGEKVKVPGKNPYPRATDYFVVPDEIKKYVGDKPKTLNIMFPTDNPEDFAPQYLKCYSMTQGLVCKGDGVQCRRKIDTATGAVADHTTEEWEYKEMTCDPENCPEMVGDPEENIRPQCRRVMNLMFLLPEVPGLGVWQLDTSSFYSIVNINSCLDVIRSFFGRLYGIPLTLSLEPREVTPPGMKKKTIQVLHLRSTERMIDLKRKALPAAPKTAVAQPEEEEPPEDLFPTEVLAEQEGIEPVSPVPAQPKALTKGQEEPPQKVKPRAEWDKITQDQIPDYLHLESVFCQLSGLSNRQMYKELGGGTRDSMGISAWAAFQTLKERFAPAAKPSQQKLV
jgi:hypothetical protein